MTNKPIHYITYQYALFLRNKHTSECKNMIISVDSDEHSDCITATRLFEKLESNTSILPEGFTLISMMVIQTTVHYQENKEK